jgi:hypothetical protein
MPKISMNSANYRDYSGGDMSEISGKTGEFRYVGMVSKLPWLAVLCFGLVACLPKSEFNDTSGNKKGSGRPTDEPEDIEGYLTDTELVTSERTDGRITSLQGAANAVAADPSPQGIIVAAWEIENKAVQQQGEQKWRVKGKNIGCTEAGASGAFAMKVDAYEQEFLLTVNVACDAEIFEVQAAGEQPSGFVDDGGKGFQSAGVSFAASCLCPPGTIYYDADGECLKPYDDCPEEIYPAGPFCGCNNVTYESACELIAARVIYWAEGACE